MTKDSVGSRRPLVDVEGCRPGFTGGLEAGAVLADRPHARPTGRADGAEGDPESLRRLNGTPPGLLARCGLPRRPVQQLPPRVPGGVRRARTRRRPGISPGRLVQIQNVIQELAVPFTYD